MKNLYEAEKNAEIAKFAHLISLETITEKDIAHLPEPVRRYFHTCGYMGHVKIINAEVLWAGSAIKLAPERDWMRLKTHQFNSTPEPFRVSHMRAVLFGVVPFEGRDIYQGGHGHMLGKVANLVKVMDAKDREIAQSALVTVFAEALVIPSYALQDYLEWSEVDDNSARARLRIHGFDVSGMFYFNPQGEFIRFETQDRYYSLPKGGYKKTPFSISVDRYNEQNGIKIPLDVHVFWHLEDGDFEYFKGTISGIRYNIDQSQEG